MSSSLKPLLRRLPASGRCSSYYDRAADIPTKSFSNQSLASGARIAKDYTCLCYGISRGANLVPTQIHRRKRLSESSRFCSAKSESIADPHSINKLGKFQQKRQNNNKATRKEIVARENTLRILKLGEQVQSSATNGTVISDLQTVIEGATFLFDADNAMKFWMNQETPESIDISFQLLDALAHLSSIAQDDHYLSSVILNTKILNKLVSNWYQTWQQQKNEREMKMTPQVLFERLEKYRLNSQNTSRARQKLKPDLETYHILMEGAACQRGFNGSVLQHLLTQKKNDPSSIQPTMRTIACVIYGWSLKGQAVSLEELDNMLDVMKHHLLPKTEISSTNHNLKPVDLFQNAIFALADTKSHLRNASCAEKMSLILNLMHTTAAEYADLAADIHPDLDTYNVVLNGFARAGKGVQAENLLQGMVFRYEQTIMQDHPSSSVDTKLTVKPTSKSFTIVITAYGNSEETRAAEKAEGVLRWQQYLNETGPLQGCLPPETVTYNNILRAWSWRRSHQAVQRCEDLRKEMYKNKVVPDQQTYGQSLKCIALSNSREKGRRAVQVWREMEFHGIKADDYSRKYFEKCIAVATKPKRRTRPKPPIPQRAPRPFD